MGRRRESRINALRSLYLMDVCGMTVEESMESILNGVRMQPEVRDFTELLAKGTASNIKKIDDIISQSAKNWAIDRMPSIDRNILRMGAFELMHMKDTPVSVVINEAIEIAKHYSSPASGKFVNGILDKIKDSR